MTSERPVICIMTTINGTAHMPLMTALQYRALIGSIGVKMIAIPSRATAANVV
jgi:hypothetical protein